MELIETLTDHLSEALEAARLYQDSQRRAAREQLTSVVTARMRQSLDVNAVLQTAVREMREALGLHDIAIQLGNTNGVEHRQSEEVAS